MAYSITIGATSVIIQQGSLQIADVINGRATLTCTVRALSGTYRPAVGAEIIVNDGSSDIFGGYVTSVRESAVPGAVGAAYRDMRVDAEDYNGIPARRYVTETLASGTLKTALQALVDNYFDDYGVALHASQVNGPTLPAITWTAVSGIEALNQLSAMSGGYIWRIDANKDLRMQVPGTDAALFDVTERTDDGDVVVETTKRDTANRIVAIVGTASTVEKTDTFTGDGSTDTFTLTYPVTGTILGVVDRYDGATHYYETVDLAGGGGATWEVDYAANTIQRVSGAPGNGDTCAYRYLAAFPIVVVVEDAADIALNGVTERAITLDTVFDRDQAESIAQGYLDRGLASLQTIEYRTYQAGLEVGQSQHITAANRDVDDDCIISEIRTANPGLTRLRRTVIAVTGDQFAGSFRDVYTAWLGGATQPLAISSPGGAGSGGGSTSTSNIAAVAYGSEPASPAAGDVVLYTNAPLLARYDGSSWVPFGPAYKFTTPPTSGWSWVNQGSATISTANGGQKIVTPGSASENMVARVRTAPSTPYTITAFIDGHRMMRNWTRWGLCWRQSSDGKMIVFGVNAASIPPGVQHVSVHKFNSATSFSATYGSSEQPVLGPVHWMRLTDNGTNRIISFSHDGQTWIQHHSIGRTDFLTADEVGFFVGNYQVTLNFDCCAHLLSWEES